MAVFLKQHDIAYFPVPKVACTSFKHLFFHIQNGWNLQKFWVNDQVFMIHDFYPTLAFGQNHFERVRDYWKFALVRDPVARFLSAYANRVHHHRELAPWVVGPKAEAAGVPCNPDIATFIDHLDTYRTISGGIRHHTDPVTSFLGPDLGIYDAVYRIEEIERCMADLNARLPALQTLPHTQTGGPKIGADELSPAQIDRIREVYAGDYALLSGYYE